MSGTPHTVEAARDTSRRDFEGVRAAFAENFARRRELGGACCAYYQGEPVVDIWGGIRDRATGAPWQRDTMVLVYSATKGLAAMTLALAHSRRWLDYDERIATYWPEFAQHGKDRITVRQLLAHQAGLFAFDEPVDRDTVADLDRLAAVMARQTPAWEPGTRQAYHAITLGFYESELLRRVDPKHRSLGQFFEDEIARPLGIDAYIRLPESVPNARLATLSPPSRMEMLLGFPLRLTLDSMNRRSNIYRALATIRAARCHMTRRRCTRGTWRCHRAAASRRRAPSPGPTACSRPMAATSDCDAIRSTRSPRRPSRRRTGSMTSACTATRRSPSDS